MTRRIACSLLLLASLAHAQSRAGANSRFFGRLGGGSGGGGGTTSRQFTSATDVLSNSASYFNTAMSFTIAFWFKSASTAQTDSYVSAIVTNFGNQTSIIYGYTSSGGKAQLEFLNTGGTGTFRTGSQITIPDTNWHHVAYRYNGTEWAYFLDGVKTVINASFGGNNLAVFDTAIFELGNGSATALMSLARYLMSTDALTDGQIAALAGGTCSSSGDTNVVAYWLLGQGSPEPESSPSPNTNSLTVSGTSISTGPTCSGS